MSSGLHSSLNPSSIFFFIIHLSSPIAFAARRFIMAAASNSLSLKHSLSLWCPHSTSFSLHHQQPSSVAFRGFRRSYVSASSDFANDNREFVFFFFFRFVSSRFWEWMINLVDSVFLGLWLLVAEMLLVMLLVLSLNTGWRMDGFV